MKKTTTKLALILAALATVVFTGCSMFGDDDDDDTPAPTRAEATGIAFAKNTLGIDGAEDTYLQFTVTPKEIQNKVHMVTS